MTSELNVNSGADLIKMERSDEKLQLQSKSESANVADSIFDDDNEDDIPAHIREARLNELKMRAREHLQLQQLRQGDALYKELSEDEFLSATTNSRKCVVHFFHADFRRCEIMHTHLQKLAVKYSDVNFCRLNVQKSKFFVNKLNIQTLPAVLCFVDGILKHRIIGFDQLGNTDNFETRAIEKRLWKLKFLRRPDNEEEDEDEEAANADRSDDEDASAHRRSRGLSTIRSGDDDVDGDDSD